MKRKKIALIILAAIIGLMIALAVLVKVLMTPERIREAVVTYAAEVLDRPVALGRIEVSLFSGIVLQDLVVSQKDGAGDFVSTDRAELRYSLLKLLMLRVEIDEVSLIEPEVEIVRNNDGSFNFDDLLAPGSGTDARGEKGGAAAGSPVGILVSQVEIRDGRIRYIDRSVPGQPAEHDVSALNLKASAVSPERAFPLEMSADWNGNVLGMSGQVDPAGREVSCDVRFNRVKARLTARQDSDDKVVASLELPPTGVDEILASIPADYDPGLREASLRGTVAFTFSVAGDSFETRGFNLDLNGQKMAIVLKGRHLFSEPVLATLKVDADAVDLDRLIPASAEDAASAAATEPNATAEIGPYRIPLALDGVVRVRKLIVRQVPVDDLELAFTLQKNVFQLSNMQSGIAGGTVKTAARVDLAKKGLAYAGDLALQGVRSGPLVQVIKPELANSVQGVLSGTIKLAGAGTVSPAIRKNLSGQGALLLTEGRLQHIPALDAVAALLEVGELRELTLDDGRFEFTITDGRVKIDSGIEGATTRLTTSGTVGLDGGIDLRSRLALSPQLGGRLHEQGRLARYLGDEKGWTTVPLRVRGSYRKPDVGLDSAGLREQAEQKVRQEVEQKIEEELQKKLKKLFGN